MRVPIGAGLALLAATLAGPAAAQLEPISPQCVGLVGTFLTTKSTTSEEGVPERSLIALTSGGNAFLSDSAQGGGPQYQPFSTSRGAWTCTDAAGDKLSFKAVMVDFTFPTAELPKAQVVRVETEGVFNAIEGSISGETRVSFYPLSSDPLSDEAPTNQLEYSFTGQKIRVKDAKEAAE
ncbi:MAG: hypothetical protein AAF615_01515 [Pseudomonadota bacterium]